MQGTGVTRLRSLWVNGVSLIGGVESVGNNVFRVFFFFLENNHCKLHRKGAIITNSQLLYWFIAAYHIHNIFQSHLTRKLASSLRSKPSQTLLPPHYCERSNLR